MIIMNIKLIFKIINDSGDEKIDLMKELIDFVEYLRIYSCDMKMSYEEVYDKFMFKHKKSKIICAALMNDLFMNNTTNKEFTKFSKEKLFIPEDFIKVFLDISSYYGSTYSDVLDRKLSLSINELERIMKIKENNHIEAKSLYNRISLLVGCLIAVILI